jgi:tetratricopeptide (TPR) repeat protein
MPTRTPAALGFLLAVAVVPAAAQPPTPDQQAAQLLTAGRKAYNDANPAFAADRFREFLQKFGGHKDAHAARYGLGLALLELQPADFQKAAEALSPPAGDKTFPDHPLALYYLAATHRGLGHKELAEGVARPNEMPQRQQAANGRFNDALRFFAEARAALEKKPDAAEWVARARCDQAEMELRLGKTKEARATAEPFAKDAALAQSKSRPLGLYYHGVASFLLNDVPAAGKSLSLLAPFDQPFGPHARYLRGRVHAAAGEKAEAAAAFEAVLAGFDKQKKDAQAALQQPDRFKTDPWEKARLEALVKGPVPDYVPGSTFYGACLNYEAGKFGEALGKFQAFVKDFPTAALKDDAQLRVGFCLVQTKQNDEAVRALQPLAGHPRLADQALYWLGKAHAGRAAAADPNNPAPRTQFLNEAIGALRSAADRASQIAGSDPEAKGRRAEILLELADTHLANKQPADAARTYEAILNEKLLPDRTEETLQRLVTALHLAGDFQGSDSRINDFSQRFPQSPLLPLVLFRGAENQYARAEKFVKENNPNEARKGFAGAAKKYEAVVAKYPEFERVQRARYGLALCHVAAEDWEKAAAVLEGIPAPDRAGDLAAVPFVLADCLVRTAPAKAEDALQDNMLREKLGNAANLLDGFVAANPKAPEAADALLKFGYCQKRLGTQLAPGNERNEAFNKARAAFERVGREFPQSAAVGSAALERAQVMSLQGDKGGATGALAAFAADPLVKAPVAPLAFVARATLLREQNQAAAAAQVMQDARQRFEGALAGDPARRDWVHLLRYHHAVALAEGGKAPEARGLFDQVVREAHQKPIGAEAGLRGGQCLVEEAKKKVADAEKAKTGARVEQVAAVGEQVKRAKAELTEAAKLLERRADDFKAQQPQSEARARMLYDAAWAYKAAGVDPTAAYLKLVVEFPTLALAVEARLELAELFADANRLDDAAKFLKEALDAEPTDRPTPPDTTDRVRVRYGAALFAKKDIEAALAQFDAVAGNEKSAQRGVAMYRAAECLMATGRWDDAKRRLTPFRDNGAFHSVPGVSDRAVLRLGHALAELKQWEPSRQTLETLVGRYGDGSPWAVDARYGMGWAFQNQGRYDDAVNQYAQVAQKAADERAGRAHLQIGLCRAAQKRWDDAGKAYATVYYGDYPPELRAAALVEHARALLEVKNLPEATRLLDRVPRDIPADSPWAAAARELRTRVGK